MTIASTNAKKEPDSQLPVLTPNAKIVLKKRYLLQNERGEVIETPNQLFKRVATAIASNESRYGGDPSYYEKKFFQMMVNLEFLPNSPALMNAGTSMNQLSACFVLPVDDDMNSIFQAIKNAAIIHKSGGGCVAKGTKVYTTFCGIEKIDTIYNHYAKIKPLIRKENTEIIDISDENIITFSFDKNTGMVCTKPISKIWKYHLDKNQSLTIHTEGNSSISSSIWHPFFIWEKNTIVEKRADELKEDDLLISANSTSIKCWPFTDFITINKFKLDPNFSYLLGLFQTDGSLSEFRNTKTGWEGLRLRFFSTDDKLINRYLEILKELTKKDYGVQLDKRTLKPSKNPLKYVTCYDRDLNEAIKLLNRDIVGKKSKSVRIPKMIFKSPLTVIGAYIAALIDGDGHVKKSEKKLGFSTGSKEFCEDLMCLLSILGIKSRYRKKEDTRKERKSTYYEIIISGVENFRILAEIVLHYLQTGKKYQRIESWLLTNHSSENCPLDFTIIEPILNKINIKTKNTQFWRKSIEIGDKSFFLARWKEKNLINKLKVIHLISEILSKYDNFLSVNEKEYLELLLRVLPSLIRVKSITNSEIEDFYDFTVKDTNNYFAGTGPLFVIHNTGFSFSKLRPKNDKVKTTGGVASGPISFMTVFNSATEIIKQGGRRRGANMGILRVDHPDIMEFIHCKDDLNVLNNFNISVGLTESFMNALEKEEDYSLINPRDSQVMGALNAHQVFNEIIKMAHKNGEPGIIFLDRINATNPTPEVGIIESTNPCLTGETLVATADGRSVVPIKQLAEEGKDTPVFTEDRDGRIAIRYMRRPRLTRKKAPIYKVTLDSGESIKATANHILYLRGGVEKRIDELKPHDSLHVLTKVLQSQRGKYYINTNKKYWRMYNRGRSEKSEHTLIAQFYHNNNATIPKDCVVHHINYDSENNTPINLEIKSIKDHDQLHGSLMKGKNNPIFKIKSNPEKWKEYKKNNPFYHPIGEKNPRYGIKVSKRTKNRISLSMNNFYKKNPLQKQLLSKLSIAKWNDPKYRLKAEKGLHQRALKKLEECKSNTNLKCFLNGNNVMVEKTCEYCGKIFEINYSKREIGYCNKECFMKQFNSDKKYIVKRTRGIRNKYKIIAEEKKEKQMQCYIDMKERLDREPLKKEWEDECRKWSIPYRLETKFGLKSYKELKESSSMYNHKVVQVENIGEEDVYNGTVDDFHSFFIGGFLDEQSTQKKIKFIKTKNCGEQPLLPMESCNLGSINLGKMLKKDSIDTFKYQIDYDHLEQVVTLAVRFLDNVIDVSTFPLPEIEQKTKENRKIGLGVMGFADLLIKLGIPYDSDEAYDIAKRVMSYIHTVAIRESQNLARERGSFPNFEKSIYAPQYPMMRNATLTTIAPTGSLSIIAGCSSGIEPLFMLTYERRVLDDDILVEGYPFFVETAKHHGFYSQELMEQIAEKGSIKSIEGIPEDIKKIFVTAHDTSPEAHVRMQAAFQNSGVDNAVSKTINFPEDASEADIEKAYMLAYKLSCKGLTVYRSGSRTYDVLSKKGTYKEEVHPETEKKTKLSRKPRYRPDITQGITERVRVGCGTNLFITVNEDEEGLAEVFLSLGKSGGCVASNIEAMGRLISLALRSRVEPEEIIIQLKAIRCPSPTFGPEGPVLSCADAVAKSVEKFLHEYSNNGNERKNKNTETKQRTLDSFSPQSDTVHLSHITSGLRPECPECGNIVEHGEGCILCRVCGYSKCG